MTCFGQRVRRQNHGRVARMHAGKFDVLQETADDDGALARGRQNGRRRQCNPHPLRWRPPGICPPAQAVRGRLRRRSACNGTIRRRNRQSAWRVRPGRRRGGPGQDSRGCARPARASASLVARPFGGWGMPSLVSMAEKSLRSSAISMLCGEVPMMLTPFFWSPSARFKRGLAAELCDGAPAFFAFVNVEDVLQRERLEEKLVAGVVIGRDGFGVGIDHQRFEAVLLEGEGGVDAAIIELDALADAVWAAAQDHDFAFVAVLDFVVAAVVSGVIVRACRPQIPRRRCRPGGNLVSGRIGGAGRGHPLRMFRSNRRFAGRRNRGI